jgi:hypothetical protein
MTLVGDRLGWGRKKCGMRRGWKRDEMVEAKFDLVVFSGPC